MTTSADVRAAAFLTAVTWLRILLVPAVMALVLAGPETRYAFAVGGALLALVAVDRASPWLALVIVGRELLIMGLRGAVAAGGDLVRPSIWGKAKANVQFLAIFLAIVRPSEELGPRFLDEYVMIAAAVITVLSAIEYLVRFRAALTAER